MKHTRRKFSLRQRAARERAKLSLGWHTLPIQPRRPLRGTEAMPGMAGRTPFATAEGLGIRPKLRGIYLVWLDAHAEGWLASGRVTEVQLRNSRELVAKYARNPPPGVESVW
jgi:hypothetical protein